MLRQFGVILCVLFVAFVVHAAAPIDNGVDPLTAHCNKETEKRKEKCNSIKNQKEKEACEKNADVSALEKDYFKRTPDKKTKKVSIDACVSKEKIADAFGPKCNELPACKQNGVSLVSRSAYNSAPNKFESCGSRNDDIAVCRKKDEETEKKNAEQKKNDQMSKKFSDKNFDDRNVHDGRELFSGGGTKEEYCSPRAGRCYEPLTKSEAKKLAELGTQFKGVASTYDEYHGVKGAYGEVIDNNTLTTAHPTLPYNTKIEVCYTSCAVVRVNNRGPFTKSGRSLDLSPYAASKIGFSKAGAGVVPVSFRVVK